MSKKFDLTNNQFDIAKYGLKDEDVYNIAKYGKNNVDAKVCAAAKTLLIDVLRDGHASEESQFFVVMLSGVLESDKTMDDYRSNLIKIINMIIKDYGAFQLKAYIAASKIADTAENASNK